MPRRLYKKYVTTCVDCPGRDKIYRNSDILEAWCFEYDQRISTEYLDFNRKRFNFPEFCKLKEEK